MEHIRAAFDLYSAGRYVLSFYVSGLAVECLLRSLKDRGAIFDEKHDLEKLAKAVHLYDRFPSKDLDKQKKLTSSFAVVVYGWENRHRFRSEASLRLFLKKKQMDFRIKGDFVKENCRRILNSAWFLIMYFLGATI